jgi:signal transduction histidine kinase
MRRLSIGHTSRFALLAGAVCVIVLALAGGIILGLLDAEIKDARSLLLLSAVIVIASALVAGIVTILFARTLGDLIDRLQHLADRSRQPHPGTLESGSLSRRFEHVEQQITADQRLLRRQDDELRVLATISRLLNHSAALDEILDTVLEQTSGLRLYKRGYIALTGEPAEGSRITTSKGYTVEELEALNAHTTESNTPPQHICLPLHATSGMIGTLCLEAERPDPDAQRALSLLADMIAITAEKHLLLESAQREVRAQKLLNEAGRVLTSTLDEQEVLNRIMREVIQVLDTEAGSVLLVDEEHGNLYFAAVAGPESEGLIGTSMPLGQGIVGWTVEHGESVLIADARADQRFYQEIDQQTGLSTQSVVCVPLFSKDKVIGAIEVLNPQTGHFTQHDLQLLESLSPQAAIAIENAFLFENIKTQMAELKRTQDQLLQAEKLSAIGKLVAGVAHELNNPLTAIVGYSELLLEVCDDREMCDDLGRINREAQRSARIVQNLLAFARQQKTEKLTIELGDIVEKTIDLLAYQLEVDNITLVRELSAQKMTVLGDSYQLQQAFLNLITNAHQAMRKSRGQGTLIIRTEATDHRTAQISFIDDGPGIPKEIASRIFDPFFTTKDVGEGTGLGLSICLGIIQEHSGRIWLDEQVDRGAAFVIELPLHYGKDRKGGSANATGTVSSHRQLSILAVDDEQEIMVLLRRILEGKGHQVIAANNGLEAQEALKVQRFDLVLCDLKMPGMNGSDLYRYIQQEYPDLTDRIIFTTGDTVSEESWTFLHQVKNRCISKPFKPRQVLDEIEALLSS